MLESIPESLTSQQSTDSKSRACIRQRDHNVGNRSNSQKPFVSLLIPAYNEALILQENLTLICQYMEQELAAEYDWEIVIVNDGSRDETGQLADDYARDRHNIRVLHHRVNFGLGQALNYGFKHCQGQYIVVLDLDLSYDTHHIGQLLNHIRKTKARIVIASPYMRGGRISHVPWLRKILSIWANRFLSFTTKGNLATLTGMVRVYDARFLRSLNLRSIGMEVNPEIIRKARILGARIDEIPAHLNWQSKVQKAVQKNHLQGLEPIQSSQTRQQARQSSMKILHHIWEILFSGFLIRPVMAFVVPSLLVFLLSCYVNAWVFIHCWTEYQRLAQRTPFPDPTEAVALAFNHSPHTFFIGGMTLMVAIQLFSLGLLSAQSKSYFEEMFHLETAIYRYLRETDINEG